MSHAPTADASIHDLGEAQRIPPVVIPAEQATLPRGALKILPAALFFLGALSVVITFIGAGSVGKEHALASYHVGFLYTVFAYTGHLPILTIVAQHHPDPWAQSALDRLGISYEVRHSTAPAPAQRDLRSQSVAQRDPRPADRGRQRGARALQQEGQRHQHNRDQLATHRAQCQPPARGDGIQHTRNPVSGVRQGR